MRAFGWFLLLVPLLAGACSTPEAGPAAASSVVPSPTKTRVDVPFVPTPEEVVEGMLDLAQVTERDIVYDLGSGDGRIVLAAARRGARAVGIELDAALVAESRASARKAGLESRATFLHGDLFEADLSEATVVTLYLRSLVNLELRPKLLRELRPGTRVVSHDFTMGDWKADRKMVLGGKPVYLWLIPEGKPSP